MKRAIAMFSSIQTQLIFKGIVDPNENLVIDYRPNSIKGINLSSSSGVYKNVTTQMLFLRMVHSTKIYEQSLRDKLNKSQNL